VQDRLNELRNSDRIRAHNREVAARFGSHEVRTHLTVARGFAEMIRDSAADDLVRSDAALVLTELDKASALATKLLTWVRIDTVSAGIPMHLGELLRRIVARWAATTDRDLRCDVAVGLMLGDSERLEAAIDCLVENAVKFTEPGDRIVVSARTVGADVVMSVSDTGTGIPHSDLHRITEVFQTGSSAGDRAGSGLGLAIVRAIVEARGGALNVDSTEGIGTTVSIVMRSYGAEQAPTVASAAVVEAATL
jgi:signal transduction histidine kinase